MTAISQTNISNAFSSIKIYGFRLIFFSLKFVPNKGPMNNNTALVQIMARLLKHICVTLPQWVKDFPNDICILVPFYLHGFVATSPAKCEWNYLSSPTLQMRNR